MILTKRNISVILHSINLVKVNHTIKGVCGSSYYFSVFWFLQSHTKDRGQFYKDAQTCLLQAKSWEDFIQTIQKIQGDQTVFQLPTSVYTCTEDLYMDTISMKLMPEDTDWQLIPKETVGDGNCLFRSHLCSLEIKIITWNLE